MADLSFLPPIGGDAIEVDPLDLDNYQPPSETPLPLPVGNYLLRLIDGAIEKKDGDGNVEGVFPILFDLTEKGYLKATYSVAVVGRMERNADKTETVTGEFHGRKVYKEFKNADFDAATGEVEFEGQMYTAYNEVDGWFRWAGAEL